MKVQLQLLFVGFFLSVASAEVVTLAHPGEAIPENRTVIWSPVFQASWDKLNVTTGGPPVKVEPPNKLIEALNSFQWQTGQVMPEGAWKAWCGDATPEFLAKVNKEAAQITQESEGPFKLTGVVPGSMAFFGLLDREVEFQKAFFRATKIPMNFQTSDGEVAVKFFGVKGDLSEEFGDAVRVLAWRPTVRSQAIQILCKDSDDTVILYQSSGGQDFATACRWIRKWRSDWTPDEKTSGAWNDKWLHDGDDVRIPYLSLETEADFAPQLQGERIFGENSVPRRISRAEQIIRFQLHEKGATVRVQASGQDDPFGGSFSEPRHFIYDRPFFVFLWRDQAEWPYFGAWIGDASALDPVDF